MKNEDGSKSWWHTLPGILSAVAGVIVAITGLVVALGAEGCLDRGPPPDDPPPAAADSDGQPGPDVLPPEEETRETWYFNGLENERCYIFRLSGAIVRVVNLDGAPIEAGRQDRQDLVAANWGRGRFVSNENVICWDEWDNFWAKQPNMDGRALCGW